MGGLGGGSITTRDTTLFSATDMNHFEKTNHIRRMSAIDLSVEGQKGQKELIEEKHDESIVMEQVSQMDAELIRPVEISTPSRDIRENQSIDSTIEKANFVSKRYPSDKQLATLQKARAAKAEKAKVSKFKGTEAAKGTTAPDLLTQITTLFNEKFEAVNQQLHNLRRTLPYEAPLQSNHIVPPHQEVPIPVPSSSELFQLQSKQSDSNLSVPISSPTSLNASKRQRSPERSESLSKKPRFEPYDNTEESKRFKNMFTKALQTVNFVNSDSNARAQQNIQAQGSRSVNMSSSANMVYF